MLAVWASQYGIRARIIDQNATRIRTGRADGLHSRTLEILHSFGLDEHFLKAGCEVNEICAWNPDPGDPEKIIRTERTEAEPRRLSRYSQVGLNQGDVEQILIDYLDSKGGCRLKEAWPLILFAWMKMTAKMMMPIPFS
jgi:phenol 2-monooxygenase (NADPH)